MNAVSAPRASAVFSSPSSKIGNGLTSDEWNVTMARHLGLKIFTEPFPCPARGCNKMMDGGELGPLGNALGVCKKGDEVSV